MSSQERILAGHNLPWGSEIGRRLPNWLTFLRFLAVPLFVILLVDPTPVSSLWATGIFVAASLTDLLDGYLARRYHAESPLGTMLDPLADKVLVMAALVMLAATPGESWVPAWMVVILLGREMMVSGLRALAAVRGTIVAAGRWAKHKTAWSMLAIVFLLIHEPYRIYGVLIDFHFSGMVFLWISMVLSVVTGIAYAVQLKAIWKEEIKAVVS